MRRLESDDEPRNAGFGAGLNIDEGKRSAVPILDLCNNALGHKRIETTQNIYAHALPSMQKDAAAKMASLLR